MAPAPGPRREYRYERKFFIDELDAAQALGLIKRHPALFSEIYPPRFINNIYFDSPWMESYTDNIDGAPRRRKARIRWYHDLFRQVDDPILELKIKEGLMGTKISYPFPGFNFMQGFSEKSLRELVKSSDLPGDVISYLMASEPVLVNRYRRWYLATPDRAFRVTVDTGLRYYHLKKFDNQFLFQHTDRQSTILELKYKNEDDPRADRISDGFPFRMTRSSKYVQGIDLVYL